MSLFDDDPIEFVIPTETVPWLLETDDWCTTNFRPIRANVTVQGDHETITVPTDLLTKEIRTEKIQYTLVEGLMEELGPEALSCIDEMLLSKSDEPQEVIEEKAIIRDAVLTTENIKFAPKCVGDIFYDEDNNDLYIGTEVSCHGSPKELLSYVARFKPGKFKEVLEMFRIRDTFVVNPISLDWNEILHEYRQQRAKSRCLDLFSKADQTPFLEQDHLSFRYQNPLKDLFENVYWLTLDPEKPDVPWALQIVDEVDPVSLDEIDKKVKDDDIVLANIVIGDEEGGEGNNMTALTKLWNKTVSGTRVNVEMFLDERLDDFYKGYLLSKPMKHNLVGVFQLDPGGVPLIELFNDMFPQIEEANIKRNRRYHDPTYMVVEKRLFRTPVTVQSYFKNKVKMNSRKPCYRIKKKNANDPTSKTTKKRIDGFKNLCRDSKSLQKMIKEDWPYAVSKGPYYGMLELNDIGYGTAQFCFATIVKWAEKTNTRLRFKQGAWRLLE